MQATLVALDSKTGDVIWEVAAADYRKGYSNTVAPLIVKDMVVIGIAGAEFGTRDFVDAYDAETGQRVWRFWTVPGPGEPGNETWGGELLEAGRGIDLDHGQLRPRPQPHLLGHWQSRPGSGRLAAPRRQPL